MSDKVKLSAEDAAKIHAVLDKCLRYSGAYGSLLYLREDMRAALALLPKPEPSAFEKAREEIALGSGFISSLELDKRLWNAALAALKERLPLAPPNTGVNVVNVSDVHRACDVLGAK